MNWKPIVTAPKENTPIDIWSKSYGRLPNYRRIQITSDNVFYDPVVSGVCVVRDATHWLPIPEGPK